MAGIRIAEVLQTLARTGRINQGDDVFLQSLQGRIRNNIQFNPAKEFVSEQLEQNEKKKKRLLSRADDFNAHFNSKQALQNPKYREVVNVENKNYIDDVEGLKTAYANNTGLFRSGNTLYISGTGGKSGFCSKVNDVFSDIFLIPTHNLQFSDKYRDVMNELEKNPDVTRLVGHSVGPVRVLQEINNRNNQKYITTTYNAPFIAFGNRGEVKTHIIYDFQIKEMSLVLWIEMPLK